MELADLKPLNFDGLKLDPDKERKIALIGAIVGIAGVALLYLKSRASASQAAGTQTPSTADTSGLSPTSQTDYSGLSAYSSAIESQVAAETAAIAHAASLNWSDATNIGVQNTFTQTQNASSSGSSGGGGSFSVFGLFSIGGGGGGSNSQQESTTNASSSTVNYSGGNTISASNLSEDEFNSLVAEMSTLSARDQALRQQSIKAGSGVGP